MVPAPCGCFFTSTRHNAFQAVGQASSKLLLRSVLALLVFLTFASIPVMSQTSTGRIVGQVEDAQNRMIPGATVSVISDADKQALSVKTDDRGLYSVSALQPGTYTITVSKTGFNDEIVNAIAVSIASTSTVNVAMKVGSASETVTVNAQSQLIDQTTPTISTAVPEQISQNIPTPERSALELVMLAPGVQGNPMSDMDTDAENPGVYTGPVAPGASFAIGGGRPGSATQLVDGVDLTMIGYPRAGLTFSGEDLKQITVQSGGISAKYGRSGGGVINQASRGGSLQYHGMIGFRHQDPFFEATTFGQGTINTPNGPKAITQDVHQNLFTGILDGPVPIPWLGINKNTFFFASFEPLRAATKVYGRIRVPTPAELSGDFSNSYTLLNNKILATQGYAAAVAAPRVGGLDYQFPLNSAGFPDGPHYNTPGQYIPIPNANLSAQLSQNPFAKFVLSQLPTPNANGGGNSNLSFYNAQATYANDGTNAMGVRGVQNTDNRYNIRVDQNLGPSNHLFVRYTDVPVIGTRYDFTGPNSPLDRWPVSKVDSRNLIFDYTHIFRSNLVNDLHSSYTLMDYRIDPAPAGLTKDFAAQYGLTPSEMGKGFPQLSLDAVQVGSSTGGNDGGLSVNEVYQFGDDLSVVDGAHNISIGADWRAMQLNRLDNTGLYGGSYSFAAGNTSDGSAGGNATASFILGSINNLAVNPVQEFYYRYRYFAVYAQDDWKVSPRLTLNLGLRYSLEIPRTEKNGLQGSFVPDIPGSLNGVAATGAFAFSGHNGLPTQLYPVNYNGWEPRVGFAYLVNPRMTVRGSADMMHAPMTGVTNSAIPALSPSTLHIGGANGGADPTKWVNYITNPVSLPSGGIGSVLKPPAPAFAYATGSSYGTRFIPLVSQSNAVPYTVNWSLSTQYQISNSIMVQAAYAGNQSHHLFSPPEDVNVLPLSTLTSEIQSGFNFSSNATQSIYGVGTGNANINNLPYPQFYLDSIDTTYVRENSASYNALYLNGVDNLSRGLTLIGSFTWSKSLDDGSSGAVDNISSDAFGFSYPQSPFTPGGRGERSYSTYDIPTHIVLAYNWSLPIGKGQSLNLNNPILNAVFGGLQFSGMFNAESGYPAWPTLGSVGYFYSTLPVCNGGGTANCTKALQYGSGGNAIPIGPGYYQPRPNLVRGVPLIKHDWQKDPFNYSGTGGYLNPAAFAVPGSPGNPQFGNSPRTLGGARSPHTIYFDMSGSKNIPIKSDRARLIIKADAFNIFNHNNYFLNPNSAHNFTSSLDRTSGSYIINPQFGVCNPGNSTPGRTFALGASVTF